MIRTLHEGCLAAGITVPLTKLCIWFGVPRRTVSYGPHQTLGMRTPAMASE
ncbi:MAG: hypothetical protein AAGC86_17940 [Pseudomonadota bacterium]